MAMPFWKEVRRQVRIFRYRKTILEQLRLGPDEAWPLIERIFSGADAVYAGLGGADGHLPFEAGLIERLAEHGSKVVSVSINPPTVVSAHN